MTKQTVDTYLGAIKKHFKKVDNAKPSPDQASPPKIQSSLERFDWALYCSLYDDLRDGGILDENKALAHYAKYGKKEGRILRVLFLQP